jgi:hypothetical protein
MGKGQNMSAKPADEQQDRLFEFEHAFEMSRAADVPTYAPVAFAKAMRRFRDISRRWSERQGIATLEQDISQARAALEDAITRASKSQPYLSSLVRARTQATRNRLIAYHAPRELNKAEQSFQDALRYAESEDISSARELARTAEAQFFDATITSLERGAIKRLEHEVEYSRRLVGNSIAGTAQTELDELMDASRAVRDGTLSLAAFKARIASTELRLRRLLDLSGVGPFDPEVIDPPAPPGGGFDPETFARPKAPLTMRIRERNSTSLTVVWQDRASFEDSNVLERSVSDGPWEVVAEFGPVSGWGSFEDTGLNPDTLHRYRVRVQNQFGSNVTPFNNTAAGYTKAREDLPVWRVQLAIRVADVPDAGSGDAVRVGLNSPLATYSPNGNSTWLDHAPRPIGGMPTRWEDDFQRGTGFSYDLDFSFVNQLSDITMISLRKEGTDAVGIAEFGLVVNGREVFKKVFGDTASTCLWLDEGDGYTPIFTVYHPELRTHASWQSYIQSPPTFPQTIPNEEIVSRFEAIVGDSLHGTQAYWRKTLRAVQVSRVDDGTLGVRVRLAGEAGLLLPNPNVDIEFDLRVSIVCNEDNTEARLRLESGDVRANADFNLLIDLLGLSTAPAGLGLLKFADYLIEKAVKAEWQPIVEDLAINPPWPGLCPRVRVEEVNGRAVLNFRPI